MDERRKKNFFEKFLVKSHIFCSGDGIDCGNAFYFLFWEKKNLAREYLRCMLRIRKKKKNRESEWYLIENSK